MPIFLKILQIVWQLILEHRQTDVDPFLHPEERQKVKHISYLTTNLHTSNGFLDNGTILRENSINVTL